MFKITAVWIKPGYVFDDVRDIKEYLVDLIRVQTLVYCNFASFFNYTYFNYSAGPLYWLMGDPNKQET